LVRFGPAVTLPTLNDKAISVGTQGEYAADYFLKFENISVNQTMLHCGSVSTILKHQLKQWMGEVSPGVDIDFDIDEKHDNYHSYAHCAVRTVPIASPEQTD
jgi:hypothetical protein